LADCRKLAQDYVRKFTSALNKADPFVGVDVVNATHSEYDALTSGIAHVFREIDDLVETFCCLLPGEFALAIVFEQWFFSY
jgi:hypothetical protein